MISSYNKNNIYLRLLQGGVMEDQLRSSHDEFINEIKTILTSNIIPYKHYLNNKHNKL